jgi:hypothetical protein
MCAGRVREREGISHLCHFFVCVRRMDGMGNEMRLMRRIVLISIGWNDTSPRL